MVEVGAGMLHARPIPRLAGEGHFFQPTDTKGFIAEMQKQFAEVQTIKRKESQGRAGT